MELTFPLPLQGAAETKPFASSAPGDGVRLSSATLVLVASATCPDPQLVLSFVERLHGWFVDVDVTVIACGVAPDVALDLKGLVEIVPDTLVVFLSEQVHGDVARLIGIDHAVGDFVVFASPTAEEERQLPQMIGEIESGADLVTAVPVDAAKHGLFERLLARSFGALVRRATGVSFEERPASLRVLSRAAALYIVSRRESELLVRARSLGSAFPAAEVTFDAGSSNGGRKRSLRRDMARAVRLMATGSAGLLRASSYLALLGGSASALYALYVLAVFIFLPQVEPGWTTLSLQLSGMLFLFSVQFLLLAENVIHLSTNSGISHRRHLIVRELRSSRSRRAMALNVVDAAGKFHLGAPEFIDHQRSSQPWQERH